MPIAQEHELHKRRLSRNLGLGLTLIAFVVLVFGMTIVKVQHQDEAKKAAHLSLTAGAKK
ncbi:hypothetical protein [Acidimangrovimonas pyrenivorans]|uniref:Cytochrome C oxidase assembly protein n=1 Tax=Acidimangrovimonas pyrenivorans TaxID=2030798 RepID=A0ABV7ALZ2_9RHOB